jgi:hypothetical protein
MVGNVDRYDARDERGKTALMLAASRNEAAA